MNIAHEQRVALCAELKLSAVADAAVNLAQESTAVPQPLTDPEYSRRTHRACRAEPRAGSAVARLRRAPAAPCSAIPRTAARPGARESM